MASAPQALSPKVAAPPPRINPEKLTEIPINNGQDRANLMREVDPKGAIVVHAVKKSSYVHDRLHALGRITNEQYDAAERFRKDFERANLSGRFSTIDLFRSAGGTSGHMSDSVAEARARVNAALDQLGMRKSGKSMSQSCMWFVVGCGDTIESWSLRIRNSGENMSEGKATGYLDGALEKLAVHYGIVNIRDIKEQASTLAEKRGSMRTIDHVISLVQISAVGDAKDHLLRFNELLKGIKEKIAKSSTVY